MLSKAAIETISSFVSEKNVKLNEPLANHTTFKIGGPAQCFVEIENEEQLLKVAKYLRTIEIPFWILGNGSNTLFSDSGYEGVILHIDKGFSAIQIKGTQITAKAGALLVQVSKAAQAVGLTGLEFAAGIPGTVGGAVVMNAGAYDGEMKQVVKQVTVLSPSGEYREIENAGLEFGYRTSVLKNTEYIVSEVIFNLELGNPEEIKAKMDDFNQRRRDKQPLEFASAGSTFKRPEGYFAGKLIMDAGLRGFQIGGAKVSDKHCGFVINTGNATSADVEDLITEVQARVEARFGVRLEPEIVIVK